MNVPRLGAAIRQSVGREADSPNRQPCLREVMAASEDHSIDKINALMLRFMLGFMGAYENAYAHLRPRQLGRARRADASAT